MNQKRLLAFIFILLFACFVVTPAFALTNRPKEESTPAAQTPQDQSKPQVREMQLETGEIEPIGGEQQQN